MTFLGRATRCRGERRCTARWRFDPPVLYAGTQNLGSSVCGSTEHAVSGIGGLEGSFRAGAGLFALGLVDGESHAS